MLSTVKIHERDIDPCFFDLTVDHLIYLHFHWLVHVDLIMLLF